MSSINKHLRTNPDRLEKIYSITDPQEATKGPICIHQFPVAGKLHAHCPVVTKGDLRSLLLKAKSTAKSFGYDSIVVYWSHHADGARSTRIRIEDDAIIVTGNAWA